MIQLQKISKTIGSRTLFEDVSLSFLPGHRYGLTGPNGSGKSTLMRMIMGLEEVTTGQIALPRKVGFLKQNIEAYRDVRVVDCIIMGNDRLWKALVERDALYEGEMSDAVGMRLAELEEIIGEEDGYSAQAHAEALLVGAGIESTLFEQKMGAIPTDMQFRALLCQALFGEPQALLLDEPTNHLDLSSISWLEGLLHAYKGALIVISHDRHFLNTVATDIADIDYETIILYPGNYDDMVMAKTSVRERADHDAKSKEKKIEKLREFVAKFGAGTRASQVQSRLREIQRLQPQELKKSNISRPYIRFPRIEKPSGKLVYRIEGLCKGYENHPVIHNFNIEVLRGDKVAIIGNNGRGKTTLLKCFAKVHPLDSGTLEMGHEVKSSYFPQNHSDLVKRESISIFEWLRQRKKGLSDQDIRGVLGKLLFGGDDAFKNVATLSGGETARLILAGMMLEEHNTILLDEPNNHLDLEAVCALAWGLQDYAGTVIFASHDRDLVASVATRVIAFEEEGIRLFNGPLEDYLAQKS